MITCLTIKSLGLRNEQVYWLLIKKDNCTFCANIIVRTTRWQCNIVREETYFSNELKLHLCLDNLANLINFLSGYIVLHSGNKWVFKVWFCNLFCIAFGVFCLNTSESRCNASTFDKEKVLRSLIFFNALCQFQFEKACHLPCIHLSCWLMFEKESVKENMNIQ